MSNPNPSPETRFQPGQSGNPSGRPRNTLKDYIARKLNNMSDDEKEEWLKAHNISGDLQWRMGEGNPESKTDVTSAGEKIDFSKVDPKQVALVEDFEDKLKEGYGATES